MVAFVDEHAVPVPRSWTAIDFTEHVLTAPPGTVAALLDAHDRVLGPFDHATRPDDQRRTLNLVEGLEIGAFVFTRVGARTVEGEHADEHHTFDATFRVTEHSGGTWGVVESRARSLDRAGAAYLWSVWPGHKLFMSVVLRSAMRTR